MPDTKPVPVKDLLLDLSNFRTVPQADELHGVQAMIATSPDRFWALMESLIDDGYLPTENILVLKKLEAGKPQLIVKEGNRRIAALKLIYGYIPNSNIPILSNLLTKIVSLTAEWKTANEQVSCAIYESKDAATVDRIVKLAHGKGEKAGRDQWNAVARARHNRDVTLASEPGLDLLEKYLKNGKNLTTIQTERWSGDYPLTVLNEAITRISPRFGAINAPDLSRKYPSSIQYRNALEEILRDIGLRKISFRLIRNTSTDFAVGYGVPIITPPTVPGGTVPGTPGGGTGPGTPGGTGPGTPGGPPGGTGPSTPVVKKPVAVAIQDPRAVKRMLKAFKPVGNNRQKVVTLRVKRSI
jgi:hypothetical protein